MLVDSALAKLGAGVLPDAIEREQIAAPGVKERAVQGIRLLVLYIAQAREPVEDVSGRIRWRTGGHCTPVDRAGWWLSRQRDAGYDQMAAATQRTEPDVAPGAVVAARRYLASWAKERGTDADGAGTGGQGPRQSGRNRVSGTSA